MAVPVEEAIAALSTFSLEVFFFFLIFNFLSTFAHSPFLSPNLAPIM